MSISPRRVIVLGLWKKSSLFLGSSMVSRASPQSELCYSAEGGLVGEWDTQILGPKYMGGGIPKKYHRGWLGSSYDINVASGKTLVPGKVDDKTKKFPTSPSSLDGE